MRILLGIIAALVVAVGLLAWRLEAASGRADLAEVRATAAEGMLRDQVQQNQALAQSFQGLDAALQGQAAQMAKNNRDLAARLRDLANVTKTEGDSNETMACLHLPVPRQSADRMR